MFTGIIKELGKLNKIINKGKDIEIEIASSKLIKRIQTGNSISVNGCCLTIKACNDRSFSCDISFNTLNTTTLKYLKIGNIVNLEDSLTPEDKLGGHFVSGHIDCVSKILKISNVGRSFAINLELPPEILPFVAHKGSIAVDGISLTVSEAGEDYFSVVIIPYTFENTNLYYKKIGDLVNIEVDLISRYIAHFLETRQIEKEKSTELKNKLLREKLEKYGFTK